MTKKVLSIFNLLLWNQTVGMLFGWSFKKFFFVDRKYTKETRGCGLFLASFSETSVNRNQTG
jgi:hypothetical protein